MPRLRLFAAAAALTAALAGPVAAQQQPAAPGKQPLLGEPAPSFRLEDVTTGKTLALEDLRGRFIVLHFGASW